jgi:hypothetical protein
MTVPANTRQDRSSMLREIAKAAGKRQRAADARKHATVDLREWALRAQGAGCSITEIAHVAGLSRQGLYDLLGDRRPS